MAWQKYVSLGLFGTAFLHGLVTNEVMNGVIVLYTAFCNMNGDGGLWRGVEERNVCVFGPC